MVKITGLDKLTREMKDAQKAFGAIDGETGSVNFDPHDPASVVDAIAAMEQMIDERLGAYQNNIIAGPMAAQIKENYRQAIIDKAAEARAGGSEG